MPPGQHRQKKRQEREWQRRHGIRKLRPQELDVYQLLLRFLLRLREGRKPSLATFKQTWQDLQFSFIFEAPLPGLSRERYVQLLYTITLDCLAHAIPPVVADHLVEAAHARLQLASTTAPPPLALQPHRQPPPEQGQAQAEHSVPGPESAALPAPPLQQQEEALQLFPPPDLQLQCPPDSHHPSVAHTLRRTPGEGGLATLPDAESHLDLLARGTAQQHAQHGAAGAGAAAAAGAAGAPSLLLVAAPKAQEEQQQRQWQQQEQGLELLPTALELQHEHPLAQLTTDPDLLPESELEALASLVPASTLPLPELPMGPCMQPGAGAGPHSHLHVNHQLELEGSFPPDDLDAMLVNGGSHQVMRLCSVPVAPVPGVELGGGADHDEWLEHFASHVDDVPAAVSTAAAAAAQEAAAAAQLQQPAQPAALTPTVAPPQQQVPAINAALAAASGAHPVPLAGSLPSQSHPLLIAARQAPRNATALPAAQHLQQQQLQQQQQQQSGAAPPGGAPLPGPLTPEALEGLAAAVDPPAPQPEPSREVPIALAPAFTQQLVQQLVEAYGVELQGAAVLALYCLYCAQPGAPTVKIYLSSEHQEALLEALPRLRERGFRDAVAAARQLLRCGALVAGGPRAQALLPATTPGGGLRREEAALIREIKFHLASTLRGLGTGGLAALCADYEERLGQMWTALGRAEPPKSVADLDVGRLLHEYTEAKHAEVHAVLRDGRQWQPPAASAATAAGGTGAGADGGAAAEHGEEGEQAAVGRPEGAGARKGSRKRGQRRGQQPARLSAGASVAAAAATVAAGSAGPSPADAVEADGDGVGEGDAEAQAEALVLEDEVGLPRLPAGAARALERKRLRERDMHRRLQGWHQYAGGAAGAASAPAALAPLNADADEDDIDHDMPDLGLEWGLASDMPSRPDHTSAALPGAGAGAGNSAARRSEAPAPSSGTEVTVQGRAIQSGGAKAAVATASAGAAAAAFTARAPPAASKAAAVAGAAAGPKRARAAKGAKRKAGEAAAAKGPKRGSAAAAPEGPAAAKAAKGTKRARTSQKAGAAASEAAPAAAAITQPAAPGGVGEDELALLAQQAQQAALVAQLAMQALAEDEDYDAEEPGAPAPAAAEATSAGGAKAVAVAGAGASFPAASPLLRMPTAALGGRAAQLDPVRQGRHDSGPSAVPGQPAQRKRHQAPKAAAAQQRGPRAGAEEGAGAGGKQAPRRRQAQPAKPRKRKAEAEGTGVEEDALGNGSPASAATKPAAPKRQRKPSAAAQNQQQQQQRQQAEPAGVPSCSDRQQPRRSSWEAAATGGGPTTMQPGSSTQGNRGPSRGSDGTAAGPGASSPAAAAAAAAAADPWAAQLAAIEAAAAEAEAALAEDAAV